jgi:hypothetical protein
MKFEIFKVGNHTSDKGITKEYSLDDLNFIASSYNPSEDEAPIVIGHPEDNDPAFGWVSSLSVSDDGKLIADVPDEKIQSDFLNLIKEGRYTKRSISLTPEGKLRHVGFLGAAKPAVKGLADIQFSSPSSEVYEFDIVNEPEKKEVEEKLARRNLDEGGIEKLSSEINQLKETIASMQSNFSESELNSTKESIEKLNSQLNSLQSKISNSDFESLLDKRIEDGTLTPAIKDKVLSVSNFMQSQNFSEDFSQSKFQSDVNKLLVTLVDSFPNMLLFDNFAEKPEELNDFNDDSFAGLEIDDDSKRLHKKALSLMKKDKISYLNAVTKLIHN